MIAILKSNRRPSLQVMLQPLGLTAFWLFVSGAMAFADTQVSVPAPLTSPPILPNPSSGGNLSNLLASAPYQFWLSCLIVLFGLAIIAGLVWSLMKTGSKRPEDISRPLIVVTVIIGSLILVSAGYSNSQIAPAFGLFGTIVGYMLGHLSQNSGTPSSGQDDDDAPTPTPTPPQTPALPRGSNTNDSSTDSASNSPGRRSIEP